MLGASQIWSIACHPPDFYRIGKSRLFFITQTGYSPLAFNKFCTGADNISPEEIVYFKPHRIFSFREYLLFNGPEVIFH
jgi:hypothetical protein